jgi:hypothetical protein
MQSNIAVIAVFFLSASGLVAERAPLTKLRAGHIPVVIGEQGQVGELHRRIYLQGPLLAGHTEFACLMATYQEADGGPMQRLQYPGFNESGRAATADEFLKPIPSHLINS